MFRKAAIAALAALAPSAALADDGVFAIDAPPTVATATPRAAQGWQNAQLRAPDIAGQLVTLPMARPLAHDEQIEGEMRSMKRTIGYVEPLDDRLFSAWPWQARPDGARASLVEFTSQESCGLRLRLVDIDPKADIEIRIFDPASPTAYGPFVRPTLDEDGGWWSPTIWGDSIGIELYAPNGIAAGAQEPRVEKVAYMPMGSACNLTPNATRACHNDVVCFPSWDDNDAKGVALIYFVSGSSCGQCTGALLNRGPADLSPLFMTANHCINTGPEASSIEVYWFYETNSCNGSPPSTPANQPQNLGTVLLKQHSESDWTLLGLVDPPVGGVRYLGWNSGNWSNDQTATGVHHPKGSFKRISFGDTRGTSNQRFCDSNGNNCVDVDVRRVDYTDGTTEGGSSGSPIFDSNRQIRGTLTGGPDGCPNIDQYYGRFDLAFDNLKFFMSSGSIASPVVVNGGVAGDPGNEGATEQGNAAGPFNAVREATFAVITGDEIQIQPGTYNQQFRIWRPMTLTRRGASGVVTIGR